MTTNMEKPYVVGMDIGGTNTVFGIVDSRGNVLATDSIKKAVERARRSILPISSAISWYAAIILSRSLFWDLIVAEGV